VSTTATAPAAFDYLLGLITAAVAAGPDTTIQVVDTLVLTYEQATYIEVQSIMDHHFDIRSLPDFAFTETYNLTGQVSVYRGDQNFADCRNDAYTAYETYVRQPIIADGNRLGNIVEWIVPFSAGGTPDTDVISGAAFTIPFAFACAAKVTNY